MKKTALSIISIMLCLAVIFGFSSCAKSVEMTEENIAETVQVVETALKEFDTKTLKKYVDSETLGVIIPFAEKKEAFCTLGRAMFGNLEMEIVSVDAQKGTVTVEVINKDLYLDASDFAYNLNRDYSKMQLLGKLEDDSFINDNLNPLIEKIDAAPMQSEKQQITLTVTQGKRNLVLSFDETAEDAVSGGALGAIKSAFGV